MEVGHEGSARSDPFDHLFSQKIRFDGRDTVTFYSFHFVEMTYQVEKIIFSPESEVAYIDSCDDNLFSSLGGRLTRLTYNVFDLTAAATLKAESLTKNSSTKMKIGRAHV